MKELFMLMATVTPTEVIIEQLQVAAEEHKLIGADDTKNKLLVYCHMFILNSMTNGSTDKMTEIIKDMNRSEQRDQLFNTNNLS
jgi:ERCC4-type nuclease